MDPPITATLQEIATHTQNTAVATISTSEALLTLPQNLSEINRSTLDITRVLEALQKTTENHSIILLQLLQTSQSLSRTIQELHQGQRESNAQLLQTNGFIIQELQEINHNPQAVLNRVLQSNLAILEEIQSSNAELELLNHTSIDNYEAAEVYRGLQIERNEDSSAREHRKEIREHEIWQTVMAGMRHVQGQLDRIAEEQRRGIGATAEHRRNEDDRRGEVRGDALSPRSVDEARQEQEAWARIDEVVERHRRLWMFGRIQGEEVVEPVEQDEDLHELAQQAGIDLSPQPPPPSQQNSENTVPPAPDPTQNATPAPLIQSSPSGLQRQQIEMGRRTITLKESEEIRIKQDGYNASRKQGVGREKRDNMRMRVEDLFALLLKYWFVFLVLFIIVNVLQDTYRVAQFQERELEMAPGGIAMARANIRPSKMTGGKSFQKYLDGQIK